MASKAKAAQKEKEKEETPEKEASETPDTPLPLLDLSDAAVKKLIRSAKKRGYVTHDQINSVLPSEEVNSEQIEDVLAMFSEMGVNVVETEEPSEEGEEPREEAEEEAESEGGELVEVQQKVPAKSEAKEPTERTDDPGAHVSARNGLGGAALARGRDRHRQAHRGRPRGDDRRPVREPAHLPGHHHLARRTQRGQGVPARHHRPRSDLCRARRQGHAGAGDRPRRPADRGGAWRAAGSRLPCWRRRRRRRRRPPARPRSRERPSAPTARTARAARPRPAKAISTTTIWRTRSRSPPSRPSSSPRWSRPSTTSPTPTSGCAACRTRTSRTSCATIRSRRRRSAATRSSRTTSSAR